MEEMKDLIFINYILDNVHGFIGLTKMENDIERLPIFKRLQDISQLGLVKRIFPCALHNRYVHSLGVMHVIDQMAIHLNQQIQHFSVAERQFMRLAAMLHDLGHYPLSHDIEQVYNSSGHSVFSNQSVYEIFLADVQSDVDKIMGMSKGKETDDITQKIQRPELQLHSRNHFHHEAVTCRVIMASTQIREIMKRGLQSGSFDDQNHHWVGINDDEKLNQVAKGLLEEMCAIIQGNSEYVPSNELFCEHFTAMIQMLHSELDADRIDYLLRDATFSGASYGTFDLGMLLQNLDMRKVNIGNEDHVWIVGVKEKGIGCAEQFMINRYLAYTQVIFHKYTSIISKMLREVVCWMINYEGGDKFYPPEKLDDIINSHERNKLYLSFTDSYFFEKLNEINPSFDGCPDDIMYFVKKLKEYSALDVDTEDVFSGDRQKQIEHIRNSEVYKDLYQSLEADEEDMISDNGLYILCRKNMTNHVPIDEFRQNFELYNGTHEEKLDWDRYQRDRLMEGLAVIYEGTERMPKLLIDDPRSMLKDICKTQQVLIRKYKVSSEDRVGA